jgi:adenylyltransferase/sulfurtransferase
VNDACVLAGKPFVYGAIHGFEGQASVFNWRGGPTYRCLFPEPPDAGTVPNCAEAGVLGVLPGLVGTIQATEAIKLLTGIGESLSGRLLLWDALAMTVRTLALSVDPRSRDIRELPADDYGKTCSISMIATSDEIDGPELRSKLVEMQLIDVREDWERETGAILPSVHVPLGHLLNGSANEMIAALDPSRPTVIFCAHGMRSLKALMVLRERHGFSCAQSLRGGYEDWKTL